MPRPATTEQFLDLVSKSGLLERPALLAHLAAKRATGPLPDSPAGLAASLVQDGLLTRFQADTLLRGKYRNFILSGKYKILEQIGAGGMGLVFLAEHTVMRRRVALKLLPAGRAADATAVERFHREARAVAQLRHPNIVVAHDVDQDGQFHFLVLEYLAGLTLNQFVKRSGPLPVGQAADYIRQAALGLQHAHEAGLVHRDIKPHNLMVDQTGTLKILDLGLARFFHDQTDDLSHRQVESPLGTADYLSPEQAQDSHAVDIRADIYSLGATFYFLLAGHSPFHTGTALEKIYWHQTRQPPPIRRIRPEVPEELALILERMMAKEAQRRYQTPAEVAEALAPWALRSRPEVMLTAPVAASRGATEPTWLLEALPTLVAPVSAGEESPSGTEAIDPGGEEKEPPLPPSEPLPRPPAPGRAAGRRWLWLVILGTIVLVAGGIGVALILPWLGESDPPGGRPSDGGSPGVTPAPRLRLLVPAYFYPAEEGLKQWERLLQVPDPASVVIIANTASGPGKAADPNFVKVLKKARDRGFTVIGYVSTRYGERPLGAVKEDVDRWGRFYPAVTGIFFDEQASASDGIAHYAALYAYARRERGMALVINNPGTVCAEGYLSRPAADVVCLVESDKKLSSYRVPRWASNYPASRFAALCTSVEVGTMRADILRMGEKRVGLCYVTDGRGVNPWGQLPSYWSAEVETVGQINALPGR